MAIYRYFESILEFFLTPSLSAGEIKGEGHGSDVVLSSIGVSLLQKCAWSAGWLLALRWLVNIGMGQNGLRMCIFLHDKEFVLLFTDSCVGCGWISRKDYQSGSEPERYVVTDSPLFEERMALLAKISTVRADVFLSPSTQSARVGTLSKGDELQVMQVEENEGEYYVRVKNDLRGVEEWVICEGIDKCDLL